MHTYRIKFPPLPEGTKVREHYFSYRIPAKASKSPEQVARTLSADTTEVTVEVEPGVVVELDYGYYDINRIRLVEVGTQTIVGGQSIDPNAGWIKESWLLDEPEMSPSTTIRPESFADVESNAAVGESYDSVTVSHSSSDEGGGYANAISKDGEAEAETEQGVS